MIMWTYMPACQYLLCNWSGWSYWRLHAYAGLAAVVAEEVGVLVDFAVRPTDKPTISASTAMITNAIRAKIIYFCPGHKKKMLAFESGGSVPPSWTSS